MQTRFTPVLEFVLDEGVKNSMEVTRLLAEEKSRQSQESGDSGVRSQAETSSDDTDTEAPAPDNRTDS